MQTGRRPCFRQATRPGLLTSSALGFAAKLVLPHNHLISSAKPALPEVAPLQDLEACYVCWDILWADGRPLAQLPLLERHRLLRQAVGPAPREGQRCGGPEVSQAFLGRFVGLLLCRAKHRAKTGMVHAVRRAGRACCLRRLHAFDLGPISRPARPAVAGCVPGSHKASQ